MDVTCRRSAWLHLAGHPCCRCRPLRCDVISLQAQLLERPKQRQQQQPQQGGSGGTVGGPRLTQLIQAAKSCEEVVQLVQQAGRQCNSFHLSAAANRMGVLHGLQPGRSDSSRVAFQQLA